MPLQHTSFWIYSFKTVWNVEFSLFFLVYILIPTTLPDVVFGTAVTCECFWRWFPSSHLVGWFWCPEIVNSSQMSVQSDPCDTVSTTEVFLWLTGGDSPPSPVLSQQPCVSHEHPSVRVSSIRSLPRPAHSLHDGRGRRTRVGRRGRLRLGAGSRSNANPLNRKPKTDYWVSLENDSEKRGRMVRIGSG